MVVDLDIIIVGNSQGSILIVIVIDFYNNLLKDMKVNFVVSGGL